MADQGVMGGAVRVAFVSSHAQPGGSERYLTELLDRVDPAWIATVQSLQAGPFVDDLRRRGLAVEVQPTGGHPTDLLRAAVHVRRRLRHHRADVVHANGVKAATVAVLATLGRRLPVIWVKHDFSWDGRLARFLARRCRVVVGVSRAVVESIGAGDDVRVVPTGIDVPAVDHGEARRSLLDAIDVVDGVDGVDGVAGTGPAVLLVLVGRLHPAKGHLPMLRALPAVLAAVPEAHLVLVGGEDPSEPAYAQRVRATIEELGLRARVHLLGHRHDAQRLVAGADVVVVPSVRDERGMGREGFGLVALEAMALGTPVVASDDGALPEVLGGCGTLVPPGDADRLAQAVIDLIGDPVAAAAGVERGRRRAATDFQPEVMAEAMAAIYREVATSRPAGTVLAYHAIGSCSAAEDPNRLWVPTARFEAQMAFLATHRRVVPLEDLVRGGLGRGRPPVAITFDDGYRSVLTEALPVLRRHRFPATVFVPTGWVGQANGWDPPTACPLEIMDADELVAVDAAGVAVESHGHAHIDLSTASPREAHDDLAASVVGLTEVLGRAPRHLAFPFRDGSDAARRAAAELGFTAAFSIDLPHQGRFGWGRVQVTPVDGPALFALKSSGRYAALRHWRPAVAAWTALKRTGLRRGPRRGRGGGPEPASPPVGR